MTLWKLASAGVMAAALSMAGVAAHAQSPDAGDSTSTAPKKKPQRQTKAQFEARFKDADKNNDGGLSREEAGSFPAISRNFDAMDADKDGKVTLAERDSWIADRRAKRQKK